MRISDWSSDVCSSDLVLYVNGVAQATRSIRTNANANSDDPLYIGHYTQADAIYGPVEGAVDSIRLWSMARSAAEIAAGMASPPPSGTAGPALALDFEGTTLSGAALMRSLNPNGDSGRPASPGETRSSALQLPPR